MTYLRTRTLRKQRCKGNRKLRTALSHEYGNIARSKEEEGGAATIESEMESE